MIVYITKVKGRAINIREYFLEDIIQLLSFQPINSISRIQKQIDKNRKLQNVDNGHRQQYKHS